MRKFLLTSLALIIACSMQAQEKIRVWKEGSGIRFTTSQLEFSEDGTSFSVADSTYDIATIDSITVVHTITVTFDNDTAYVDYGHASNVTDTIRGAHVILESNDSINELEFVLQGESTHGSLTYDGPYKCRFYLNGLNLKSDQGAALDIKCGKRVDLVLNPDTENFLEDAAGGNQKGALHCKGHLEVSGGGSLTVRGNSKHGIATKEYMEIKKSTGTITIDRAVSDAMHIGQYFQMNGGRVHITGQGGEGIQVETMTIVTENNDTIPNPDKENNGLLFIRGGNIYIEATEDFAKGIKAPSDMFVSGGTFEIKAIGDGSKGISVSGNLTINQDDNTMVMQLRAQGSVTEDENEDDVYCMCANIKQDLTITSGFVNISNRGAGTRGIQYGGNYYGPGDATVIGSVTKKK